MWPVGSTLNRLHSFFFVVLALSSVGFLRAESYEVIPLPKSGTIVGYVKFPGETPRRAMYVNSVDPSCPDSIPRDNLLVKQQVRGLKNALVVLDIVQGKAHGSRKVGVTFQKCNEVPRVQWVPSAGSLICYSEDEADHRAMAYLDENKLFEVDLPYRKAISRPLSREGLHRVLCARHFWEKAWIYVSPHPYVAVTDADGKFMMTQVPPGKYSIRAWHEGWEKIGEDKTGAPLYQPFAQTVNVTVRNAETTEIYFEQMSPTF